MEISMINIGYTDKVEAGQELELPVNTSIKTHQPEFVPWAIQADGLFEQEEYDPLELDFQSYRKSIRFFIVVNKQQQTLQDGEMWRVRVVKVSIAPKAQSKDGRKYVFIEVETLGRCEEMHEYSDYVKSEYVVRVVSGRAIISEKRFPTEKMIKKFRLRGKILTVKRFIYNGKVVESYPVAEINEEKYLDDIVKTLGRKAPKNPRALLDKLPVIKDKSEVILALDQIV